MLSHKYVIPGLAVCALVACDRSSTKEEQPSSPVTNTNAVVGSPHATPAGDISSAGNAAAIVRFNDEVPLPRMHAELSSDRTPARTTPYGGEVVAVLSNGNNVTELSRRGSWYLVMWTGPDTSKTLAGWVYKDGLLGTGSEVKGQPASETCKSGEVWVMSAGMCSTACVHDKDCNGVGGVCDGNGLVKLGSITSHGQYCVAPPVTP